MSTFTKVNEYNYQTEVLDSKSPVLVDFGAEWCQPCKRLEPILDQLGTQWQDKVKIAKVDVDESGNLAMQMQVMSVPTMVLMINGQENMRLVGLQTPDRINEKVSAYVNL